MSARIGFVASVLCCAIASASASTLRGRVKDQQCAVLAEVTVHIRATNTAHAQNEQTLKTDSSGNYSAELPAGSYEVCVQRATAASTCTSIDMPATGDKWMTTQLRDAAPDLSHLGNRSY